MKSVTGLVVRDGRSFTLPIEEQASVASAKQMIQDKMHFRFPANRMTLHTAKRDGKWLKANDPDVEQLKLGKMPDGVRKMMKNDDQMDPSRCVGSTHFAFPNAGEEREDDVHLLVQIPDGVAPTAEKIWTAEELATVHPQVQLDVWKSVVRLSVRISSKVVTTTTALVVDRDDTHLYLMTNLLLWADKRFAVGLSAGFKNDIKDVLDRHFGSTTSASHKLNEAERPQIVIEHLSPEGTTMEEVHEFSLKSDVCWCSSADLEFAIMKVVVPEQVQLVRCKMASFDVVPTMEVHVFLFRNIPYQFGPPYAIVPAQITGKMGNEINLSAHGLPEGAIVCTNNGTAVGYIVSGQITKYPSCSFTLRGMPKNLSPASSEM